MYCKAYSNEAPFFFHAAIATPGISQVMLTEQREGLHPTLSM